MFDIPDSCCVVDLPRKSMQSSRRFSMSSRFGSTVAEGVVNVDIVDIFYPMSEILHL